MPQLHNNKNKTPNHKQTGFAYVRITTSLSLAHQRKNKQMNKIQHKSHPIRCLQNPLDQPQGAETNGGKNSTLKPGKRRPRTQQVKKKNEKVEKYYTNEGTN